MSPIQCQLLTNLTGARHRLRAAETRYAPYSYQGRAQPAIGGQMPRRGVKIPVAEVAACRNLDSMGISHGRMEMADFGKGCWAFPRGSIGPSLTTGNCHLASGKEAEE
jgi:hypothetical protein